MPEAVIVSTARTPIGKAYRGAFNITHGADLGGHVVRHAVARAGVDPGEVEDVMLGCALPERATGRTSRARRRIRAGLPVTVGGHDGEPLMQFGPAGDRAGGAAHHVRRRLGDRRRRLESISLVQDGNSVPVNDEWIVEHKPAIYMPMIDTADIVAKRYKVSREAQDEYALESQRRTAAAQQARFNDEIVPMRRRRRSWTRTPRREPRNR